MAVESDYFEPYDLLLDYEDTQSQLTPEQKLVFMEAAEQIAVYQCHPETQEAIAKLALAQLGQLEIPVLRSSIQPRPRLRSVVTQ